MGEGSCTYAKLASSRTVNETEYSLFSQEAYDAFKANPTVRPSLVDAGSLGRGIHIKPLLRRFGGIEKYSALTLSPDLPEI